MPPAKPARPRAKAPSRSAEEGRGTARSNGDFVLSLYLRDISAAAAAVNGDVTSAGHSGVYDRAARQRLVLTHLRSVVRTAFDYRGLGLPLGDLINEGNIGLLRAAELFDPGRNVRFASYAQPWIRVQMDRAVSYQAWPVKVPADFNWRHSRVHQAAEKLEAQLARSPKDAEVAAECGMGLSAVRRLRGMPVPTFVSIDSSLPADEPGLTVGETIADNNAPAPDREVARHSDRQFLSSLLRILSPVEQKVIRLRYGLDDGCPRTLREVGRALGYVRQGIHRLETCALKQLRAHASLLCRTDRSAG